MIVQQYINWQEIGSKCKFISSKINNRDIQIDKVVGIARGGIIPGSIIARYLEKPFETISAKSYNDKTNERGVLSICDFKVTGDNILFVDDICDSGHTLKAIKNIYKDKKIYTAALFKKKNKIHTPDFSGELIPEEVWITFPWED
jgi:hypoxanthine phosphoribosyltransferase